MTSSVFDLNTKYFHFSVPALHYKSGVKVNQKAASEALLLIIPDKTPSATWRPAPRAYFVTHPLYLCTNGSIWWIRLMIALFPCHTIQVFPVGASIHVNAQRYEFTIKTTCGSKMHRNDTI